jgi:GNAT superfamily N-acetyltransferase
MTLSLRLAYPRDLAELLPLVASFHAHEGLRLAATTRRAVVANLVGRRGLGRVFLIRVLGEAIGYVAICFGYSIEFGGRDAFVDEFFVAPAHRGRGIGRRVLALVKAEARRLGVRALHLEVGRGNDRARRLYAALGFVPRDRFTLMTLPLGKAGTWVQRPARARTRASASAKIAGSGSRLRIRNASRGKSKK